MKYLLSKHWTFVQPFHPKLCDASSEVFFYHWWSLTKFGEKRLETRSVIGWSAEMTRPEFLKNCWICLSGKFHQWLDKNRKKSTQKKETEITWINWNQTDSLKKCLSPPSSLKPSFLIWGFGLLARLQCTQKENGQWSETSYQERRLRVVTGERQFIQTDCPLLSP